MLAYLSSLDMKRLPSKPIVETIIIIHCAPCTVNNYLHIYQIHQLWECDKSAVTGVVLKALQQYLQKTKYQDQRDMQNNKEPGVHHLLLLLPEG
jgi:hypothetical protein